MHDIIAYLLDYSPSSSSSTTSSTRKSSRPAASRGATESHSRRGAMKSSTARRHGRRGTKTRRRGARRRGKSLSRGHPRRGHRWRGLAVHIRRSCGLAPGLCRGIGGRGRAKQLRRWSPVPYLQCTNIEEYLYNHKK